MNSLPAGYTLREDGLYQKAVHFGNKGTATEILVRDQSGYLVKVIREERHQNQSKTMQRRPWSEERRKAFSQSSTE